MKTILIGLTLICSFFSVAQDQENKQFKNDISISGGISIANQPFGRYGLTYRRYVGDTWKLKFSASYDKFYSHSSPSSPIFSSDTLIILRKQNNYTNRFSTRIGVDRTLFKVLFVGADINLGYSFERVFTFEEGLEYDDNDQTWKNCRDCLAEFHNAPPVQPIEVDHSGLPNQVLVSRNKGSEYFVYGLSLNAGVNFPIGNRWGLALQYSPEISRYQSLSGGSSFIKFRHFTDLILRFKI